MVDIVMAKSVNSTAISVSWKVRGFNLFLCGDTSVSSDWTSLLEPCHEKTSLRGSRGTEDG